MATALTISEQPGCVDDSSRNRIYQRAGLTNAAPIAFAGTYTGTKPTGVQVKADLVGGGALLAYTDLTSFVATGDNTSGTWTGILSVPGDGQGFVKAGAREAATGVTSSTQARRWGVGRCILCIGDSQYEWFGEQKTGDLILSPDTYVRNAGKAGWFAGNVCGFFGPGFYAGDGSVTFTNAARAGLVAANGGSDKTLVALLNWGVQSTSIVDWDGGSAWTAFNSATDGINGSTSNGGGDFEMCFISLGGNDTYSDHNPAPYAATRLASIVSRLRTLTGRSSATLKIGLLMMGDSPNSYQPFGHPRTDANVLAAQQALYGQAQAAGCFLGGVAMGYIITSKTDAHYYPQNGMARLAREMSVGALNQWGLVSFGVLGPTIATPTFTAGESVLHVPVTHHAGGTTLKDGTGSASGTLVSNGFVVTSSGGQTVSSIALSGGEILVTMSAAFNHSDTVTVSFCDKADPWNWDNLTINRNGVPFDDSVITGETIGRPVLSTLGAISAAEIISGGGVLTGGGALTHSLLHGRLAA